MSSIFSVPVPSVFLYFQCPCISSVPVSPVFLYLQSSPAWRGHHESRYPLGRSAVDTSWPHTYEVSLGPIAEQDRQEPSNWILVNVRLQFTTQCLPCPKALWVVGKGQLYIRPAWCSPSPARSVILRECHEINLTSSFMVFPGSWFYKSFPSSEGRSRGPTSSSVLCLASLQEDLLRQLQWPSGMPSIPRGSTTSRHP